VAAARRIWASEPGIVEAWQWYYPPGTIEKWMVEAYACAGMGPAEIAGAACLSEDAVEAYLKSFFDLGGLIHKPVALLVQVIGPVPGKAGVYHDWLWKLAGLLGGKPLVDALICCYDQRPNSDLSVKLELLIRGGLALRAAHAALGPAEVDRAGLEILDVYSRLL